MDCGYGATVRRAQGVRGCRLILGPYRGALSRSCPLILRLAQSTVRSVDARGDGSSTTGPVPEINRTCPPSGFGVPCRPHHTCEDYTPSQRVDMCLLPPISSTHIGCPHPFPACSLAVRTPFPHAHWLPIPSNARSLAAPTPFPHSH
eukprot:365188-Chlamydomonas_euryale.AAC.4